MIEFENSGITGLKCVSVNVNHHYHGPTHTPRISAEIVYLSGNKPLGTVTVDSFDEVEELRGLAKGLVEAIEKEFANHIGAKGLDKEVTKKPENIKSLVKEF